MKNNLKKYMVFLLVMMVAFVGITGLGGCEIYECHCQPYMHKCNVDCGDFCVSLSADCTRLKRGYNLSWRLTFRNHTDSDFRVDIGFWPLIAHRTRYLDVPARILLGQSFYIEAMGSYDLYIGDGYFVRRRGEHTIRFEVNLNFNCPNFCHIDYACPNRETFFADSIKVYTNTIAFRVV